MRPRSLQVRTEARALALAALLLLCAAGGAASAQPLARMEELGRRLYRDGIDVAGTPVAARVDGAAVPLRGQPVACGNCHGEDGRGRPESGVDPGDVTWRELTKPYGHRHGNGRRHGAYDAASFAHAMREGVDPGGNVMAPAMPRYALSAADIEALAAWLARLEMARDAGIGETALRVGTLQPESGPLGDAGRAVTRMLAAYFDDVNRRGGVNGRRLELVVVARDDDPAAAEALLRRLIEQEEVFALLAPMSARIERALAARADAARIPVVGPLTLYPEDAGASSQHVFHLQSGVPELVEVMAVQAPPAAGFQGRPVVLLHADDDDGRAMAATVGARLGGRGYASVHAVPLRAPADALAEDVRRLSAGVLVPLSPSPLLGDLARTLAGERTPPAWLIAAPLLPRDILDWPPAYEGRITLGYPASPADRTPAARAAFAALVRDDPAERAYQSLQAQAFSAAAVLVEGLSRSGRDLSRRKLVAALEGLQGFAPGLAPRVSFNADRRIGALGGYAVAVDLAGRGFRPLGDFVRLQ